MTEISDKKLFEMFSLRKEGEKISNYKTDSEELLTKIFDTFDDELKELADKYGDIRVTISLV